MPTKLTYTVPEACELIGISPGTFYELIHTKQIVTLKIRKRRLIKHDDLMIFIENARDVA